MRLNCNFYNLCSLIPWLLYNYFHHCCALLLLVNKTWFYSLAKLRLVLQDAHNTSDFTSLWLMSTTEKCNTKPNGYSNPPCGTSKLCNTELCCQDQPGMHSHVELGAWSQKQESRVRENKVTHEAYELWHKSHRWASPPSKDMFMPTNSCLVYPLHNSCSNLPIKLVGYFVATRGRQRIWNSNLASFPSVRQMSFYLPYLVFLPSLRYPHKRIK